ncbi:MAG: DUF308 domain-containing protein [Ruminococcus sp.]|nr:DUF308 domain-containing protein [Ruminococcus sp.]
MKNTNKNKINSLKAMIISSLAYLVLGVIMIVWSESIEIAFCYTLGTALTVYGLFNILSFFISRGTNLVLELITGILSTAVSIFTLISPKTIIGIIFFIIGILIIIVSAIEVKYAFILKSLNMKYWWIYFVLSMIVILLGICTIVFKEFFAEVIMIFLGTLLIYEGISGLSILIFANHYSKKADNSHRMIDSEATDVESYDID